MYRKIIDEFKNKKVLIWGLGKEGLSTYKFIKKHLPDLKLYLSDTKPLSGYDDDYIVSENKLNLDDYDLVIKAPGVVSKFHHCIETQASLFLKYFKDNVIGITGTKGKSTTSSLLYHVLKQNYKSIYLVGNIGVPCFDIIDEMGEDSIVVFELSCHQLEFSRYSPHIAVILNLYEEHLDHYVSFEAYKSAKKQIYLHQNKNDVAIINSENKEEMEKRDNIVWLNEDIYIKDNVLCNSLTSLEIKNSPLIGRHNLKNMAVVYYIARVLYGISDKTFIDSIESFKPLQHRLEFVGVFNGITYINDSISTIGEATVMALESMEDVDTVLIGGMDRHIDYGKLIDYLNNCKVNNIILMYETGERIKKSLHREGVYAVKDLYEAVSLAKKITLKGKKCLLSPAAASYGYFKNFEERGNEFKRIVQ